MPELPEVETIRKGLAPRLIGKTITSVEVQLKKQVKGDAQVLVGRTVTGIRRHGKLLVFVLDQGAFTVHLKMTGQLLWRGKNDESVMGGHPSEGYLAELPHKHTRVSMVFSDNSELFFNDLRTFGSLDVLTLEALESHPFVTGLGPEPLEALFTLEYLTKQLHKKSKTVLKVFLLDQTNIAGLGNIYADESCFRAALLPTRLCGSLTSQEIDKLHTAIQETLNLALEHGGSTERDYRNAIGEKGTYLKVAQVYHRTGLPCMRCGEPIKRIKLAGRSTHFCQNCQY